MASANVLDINDLNFEPEVLQSTGTFVLEAGATWCGPCRRLLPVIEGIASDYQGKLRVGKLDTDDAPSVSSNLRIRAVPTIIVFRDGREVARHVGLTTRDKLLSLASVSEAPIAIPGHEPLRSRA